jgi:hypothetical protein
VSINSSTSNKVFSRRIRLVAYGASLESWLGASPHGFESHILREHWRVSKTLECETASYFGFSSNREAEGRRFSFWHFID